MRSVYVVGDVHGQYEKLVQLLVTAGLMSADLCWSGGRAEAWFMGDLFDRGPGGLATVELIMRLQQQSAALGGRVSALLGNHEMMLLAARRFGQQPSSSLGGTFISGWLRNGGVAQDLAGLTAGHRVWLASLPAMARTAGRLLIHADGAFYLRYGSSVEEVNRSFAALLQGDDFAAWDRLLEYFNEHNAFNNNPPAAREFLKVFGGRQLIHGHTPISHAGKQDPAEIRSPWIYADGLCVNVDGGMYAGGPGFVYRLPELR